MRRRQQLEEEAARPKPPLRDELRDVLVANWDGEAPDFDAIIDKIAEFGFHA